VREHVVFVFGIAYFAKQNQCVSGDDGRIAGGRRSWWCSWISRGGFSSWRGFDRRTNFRVDIRTNNAGRDFWSDAGHSHPRHYSAGDNHCSRNGSSDSWDCGTDSRDGDTRSRHFDSGNDSKHDSDANSTDSDAEQHNSGNDHAGYDSWKHDTANNQSRNNRSCG
jgi:hypothetical protein